MRKLIDVAAGIALVAGVVILLVDDSAKSGEDFIVRFFVPAALFIVLGGGRILYRIIVVH